MDLELIGKGLALATFIFTAGSYVNDLRIEHNKAQFNETRSLINRYEADGIRDAEHDLSARLLYYRVDGKDPNDPNDYPDELFSAVARETLFGTDGPEGQRAKPFLSRLFDIGDFYAEVAFCIDEAICDRGVGESYFCPRALSFTQTFSRLIAYYNAFSGNDNWAHGLDALVARCTD